MAITGIILHTQTGQLAKVQQLVEGETDLEVQGSHDTDYLIVVGEMPSATLEDRLEKLEGLDGVLAVYTTYVNVEDELAPNIQESQHIQHSSAEN